MKPGQPNSRLSQHPGMARWRLVQFKAFLFDACIDVASMKSADPEAFAWL